MKMENNKRFMTRRAFSMWIKTVACVLSILMMLYAVPTNVFAELIEAIDGAPENQADEVTVEDTLKKEVFEVIDRREETVKHFRTEDGSFTAVQYNVPVHEKDENGEWQDIDNTLSASGSEYATSNARVKFAKKTTGNETLFTLHDGNRKITMSLSGANKKVASQVTNTRTEFPEDATQLQKLMTLDKLSSKILYPDILDGVDLEYVVNSCNIKENIIVKERADSYSYTFEIQLNNLEAVLCEDGSVAISDPDTDEIVYTIPKGYMFDADGEYSDTVTYTLTNGGNGKYSLTVTADAEWINDEGRALPVTVDPPINSTAYTSGIVDTYVDSDNPSASYSSFSYLASGTGSVGQEFISYWKINSLPTIPVNSFIVSAEFSLYCQDYRVHSGNETSVRIGAYRVTTDWDSSMTWTNASVCTSTALIDYADVNAESESQYVSWDITRLYKQWNDGTANYGIALARMKQGSSDALFASSETTNDPRLMIHYRDMKGVESYWSGSSHSAGLAGNGYVNHANGNLVFALDLLGTGDALFGYTPSLVYNSTVANQFNTNENVPYKHPSSGYGWKLSTDDSLVMKTYYDETGILQVSYVWVDGDGTEHYFLRDGTSSIRKDEDGLGLTFAYNSKEQKYEITNLNHYVYQYTLLQETTELGTGMILERIKDPYGNQLILEHNTQGHPTSVKVLPSGHLPGNAVQYLTLFYNSLGLLYRIQNNVTGQVMTFDYGLSFTDSSFLSQSVSGPLYKVTYGHISGSSLITDAVISYNYTNVAGDSTDTIYRLFSAKDDSSGTELRYTYNTAGQVETVTEYGKTEDSEAVQGQSIRYTYGTGYTEVRSSGSDDVLQTGTDCDDIITHYSLDYRGRAVSVYSTNAARTAMYGATNQIYEDPNTDGENAENTVNSLKSAAVIDSVAVNHIYNGGFDLNSSSNAFGWGISSNHVETSLDLDLHSIALKMTTDANDTEEIYQDIHLSGGTYTLSADCKVNVAGMKLTMSVHNAEDPIASETYSVADSDGDPYVLNPSLTFTLEEAQTIRVKLTSVSSATAQGTVTVDNVSLVNTIGIAPYNMVQFGGFEDTYADTSGAAMPNSVWQTTGAVGATLGATGGLFDQCLRITGNVNREQRVTQRINVIPEGAFDMTEVGTTVISPVHFENRTFTVSGFAKANAPIANADALFSLSVAFYYHGESEPEIIDYHFNKELSDWQFVSGTFTSPPNKQVQYIDVSCVYANQPNTACFDQISLIEERGANAAVYKYNEAGLVELVQTPSITTYNEYDDSNNLIYSFDSQGNGCYNEYDGNVLRSQTTFKYYVKQEDTEQQDSTYQESEEEKLEYFNLLEWYNSAGDQKTNPFSSANPPVCIVVSKTEYNINTYGLNTSTVSYAATGDVTAATQKTETPKLVSSTEYNLTIGSYLFGRPTSTTDTSGNTTVYGYDSQGRRIYESNSEYEGLYKNYDALGRVTSVTPIVHATATDTFHPQSSAENVQYTYDPQTNRLTQVSTATTTYTFTYDNFGNRASIQAGGNTLAQYLYGSNNGKPKYLTYGIGKVIEYKYDELDRIQEICYNDNNGIAQSYKYVYTATGAVHSVESTESGRLYLYKYDSKGQTIGYTEWGKDESGSYTSLLQNLYNYDDESRIDYWHGTFEYLSNGTTHSDVIGQEYDYLDYSRESETSIGEMNKLTVLEAGLNRKSTISYEYDAFYRLTGKTLDTAGALSITANYTFREVSHKTSMLVSNYASSIKIGDTIIDSSSYTYTYDVDGNITKIVDGNNKQITYVYDDLGQLLRENNQILGKTYVYTYDNGGNRTSKKTYAYTTAASLSSLTYTEETYTYGNEAWGDQLTAVNSVAIAYDAIGNPTTFNGYDLTWHGRQLKQMSRNGVQSLLKFMYNADGIRTNKIVDGVNHVYTLNGTQIVSEAWGTNLLIYLYDESGSPIGLQYRTSSYGTYEFDTFYFEKNLQGDIVAVYNTDGDKIGSYTYDAWGICTVNVVLGSTTLEKSVVQTYNPFRYRGYYYDTETGLYYLQSRYYNPAWGRFLNADGYVNANGDLIGFNMYAYCSNNPVVYVDYTGKDAVYVVDRNKLKGVGHAVVFVQDEEGNWYMTQFAGPWDDWKAATVKTKFVEYNEMVSFLKQDNLDYVYLEGDFSEGAREAKDYHLKKFNNQYNPIGNNCTDYSQYILSMGPDIYKSGKRKVTSNIIIPQRYYSHLKKMVPQGNNKPLYYKYRHDMINTVPFERSCIIK